MDKLHTIELDEMFFVEKKERKSKILFRKIVLIFIFTSKMSVIIK